MNRRNVFILLGTGLLIAGLIYYKKPLVAGVQTVMTGIKKIWDKIPTNAAPFLPLLKSTEEKYNLPPTLLTRLAYIESSFNPNAFNAGSGATGILQIVPKWHPGVDAANPTAAIPYAGKFLKDLYNQFGSWEKAIAAYNWGPGNLSKTITAWGDAWPQHLPLETANYLKKVQTVIDLG